MLPKQALVLSPMVDVTDAAFRSVAKEWGADVTCSEMVSAAGLIHDNASSWRLVDPWPGESPYGVQIMGGAPELLAEAATRVANHLPKLDFLDINLGCPSPNVLRSEAGGFLLKDPKRVGASVAAVRAALDDAGSGTLTTVKMRLGMDDAHRTYKQVAEEAAAAGAAWCTLHGRTVAQGYQGHADWDAIRQLVEHVDIPVVGNGDLRTPDDVRRMRDETGCHGYFIARAAMIDPTIFRRMRQALDGKTPDEGPSLAERLALLDTYLERAQSIGITNIGALRRQAMRFVAGAPGAKKLRALVHDCKDLPSLRAALAARA